MSNRSIWLKKKGNSFLLQVKVQPNSPKNAMGTVKAEELQLRIKGIPENGKVNQNLIRYFSKEFKIPQKDIEIIQGHTSRHKCLRFPLEVLERLKEKVPEADNKLSSGEPV